MCAARISARKLAPEEYLEGGSLFGVEKLHRAVETAGCDEMRSERVHGDRVDVVLTRRELHGRCVFGGTPDLDEPVTAAGDDFVGARIDLEVPNESVVTADAL